MPHVKPALGQQKLHFKPDWLDVHAQNQQPTNRSTSRSLKRFPADHEELVAFKRHLMGIAGKRKSSTAADCIVSEISKMLYFGDPDKLDWANLTKINKLKMYMEKMEGLKIGPEGQLIKLERLCDALDYPSTTTRTNSCPTRSGRSRSTLQSGRKS